MRRSRPALNIPSCQVTLVREQTDMLTHWLDASNVYGSTAKEARDVRDGDSFLLKEDPRIRTRTGRGLLPSCQSARNNINACEGPCLERERNCQVAGDQRVNEQPGLTTLHTVWLREHNRIALALESLNQHWHQETIFQESRRILIAEWQHIIYNEFLPLLLGKDYMIKFNLFPRTNGYTQSYNENIDPRINNEFATAAFRFSIFIFLRAGNFIRKYSTIE